MLKDMIFAIIRPFLTAYALLRYKSIWGLKQHLQKHPSKLMSLTYGHYFMQRGSFVGLTSEIAGTPCLPHGIQGIFISNTAKIGKDVVIFQQVTIGSNTLPDSKTPGSPVIGNNVYIGAGAKIIGGVTIADNCRIGANAVVYEDMPPHSVAVCAPTRIIQKEQLDNTFTTTLDGEEYYFKDGKLRRSAKK
ncbi:serine acetyltransferase [Oscillospiraceae bacterium PP1C4]